MPKVKEFRRKSDGQSSQIFGFEACDPSGVVEIAVFGDSALTISSNIQMDGMYKFRNGKVEVTSDSVKIIFNDKT
jgi:hypothetical protein